MLGKPPFPASRAATKAFSGEIEYYVDEMWPLVTRMYVWGLDGRFGYT
jgi:hypothetical protein